MYNLNARSLLLKNLISQFSFRRPTMPGHSHLPIHNVRRRSSFKQHL